MPTAKCTSQSVFSLSIMWKIFVQLHFLIGMQRLACFFTTTFKTITVITSFQCTSKILSIDFS